MGSADKSTMYVMTKLTIISSINSLHLLGMHFYGYESQENVLTGANANEMG